MKDIICCEDCREPVQNAVKGEIGKDMVVIEGKYWHSKCFMGDLIITGSMSDGKKVSFKEPIPFSKFDPSASYEESK